MKTVPRENAALDGNSMEDSYLDWARRISPGAASPCRT
jgi:hypothetical protein